MRRNCSGLSFATLVGAFSLVGTALGQEPTTKPPERVVPPPTEKKQAADPNSVTTVTVEKIMDQAVKNITTRYNLNEEQAKITDEIMKRNVRKFLKEHESDVWPLIREMILTQFGAKPPENIDDVKRIGTAGKPMSKLAHEAILEGNREWRQYLTPDQQRMHDYDMREMDKTFERINQNLDKWEKGEPPPGGLFPPPPDIKAGPTTPRRPPAGLPKPPEPAVAVRETFFETFVEQFIKENELDAGQITAAKSILSEYKVKATDFRAANKDELAKAVADHREAAASKEREKIAAADESRKKLLQPVYQFFDEMESRLTALLTSVQLDKYKERKASLDPTARQKALDQEMLPELTAARPAVAAPKPEPAAEKPQEKQKTD